MSACANTTPSITLIQISDAHLEDQPGGQLLGMDTDVSLADVIALAKGERGRSSMLLATGDISNSGGEASYRRFQHLSEGLANQALWLPGNHDSFSSMQQVLGEGPELMGFAELGNWRVIMLDSTIPRAVGGNIRTEQLDFLRTQLQLSQSNNQHVIICLHHHPITIGCDWLDNQQVNNADEFFALLDEYNSVRAVVWGHVHQELDIERNGVRLLASPSTCVQFAPKSADFKLDRLNPGYRWFDLHADGTFVTAVSRVQGDLFDIDYDQSSGY